MLPCNVKKTSLHAGSQQDQRNFLYHDCVPWADCMHMCRLPGMPASIHSHAAIRLLALFAAGLAYIDASVAWHLHCMCFWRCYCPSGEFSGLVCMCMSAYLLCFLLCLRPQPCTHSFLPSCNLPTSPLAVVRESDVCCYTSTGTHLHACNASLWL